MDELLRALLLERFGTVAEWEREARRLPDRREVARRRRVLALGAL